MHRRPRVLKQRHWRRPSFLTLVSGFLGLALFGWSTLHAARPGPVVLLCASPELEPEALRRMAGTTLWGRLRQLGHDVRWVDPWDDPAVRAGGLNGLLGETYPKILREAAEGASEVLWLGHGACGLVPALAAAGLGLSEAGPRRVVALGSPYLPTQAAPLLASVLSQWAEGTPVLAQELMRVSVGAGGSARARRQHERAASRLQVALRPVEPVLAEDLRALYTAENAQDMTLDGALAHLFIVGSADGWAPPEDVLPARRAGADVAVLSVANGAACEYGHAELLLAPEAALDVSAAIEAWLLDERRPR